MKNLGSLRPLDGESLGGLLIRTLEAKIPIRGARECWRIESTETIDDLHPQSKQGELLLQLIQATPVYLACPGLEARCDALHPELLTALFAQLGEQEHFRVWTPYDAFDHIKRIYWDYCDSDTERKEQMRRQLHLERGVEPSDAEVLEVMKEEWGDIPTLSEVLEELGERYVRPSTLESNQARELCAQDKHLKHIWSLGEQLKSIPLPPYSCGYTPCTLLLDPHPELERNSECFDEGSFSEMIPQRVTEGERLASAQYGFDVHTTPPRNLSLSHPPVSPVRPTRPRQPLPPQDLRFPLYPLSTLPTLPA